jgi:SOS-response transcriptional repressor LexA
MTLAERITEAILGSGMRPVEVARAAGRSPSAISQLMDGTTKSLKAETAERLQQVTGYRSTWLVSGTGPKRVSGNTEPGPSLFAEVPLISWVTAGKWDEAVDSLLPGDAERWMPCPVRHGPQAFALRVRGDSMTATYGRSYPEGCIVFVDPDLRAPSNGQRVIAKLAGADDVTFKVYKEEDGRRWLQPLNAAHEPIRDQFRVLGTVIGKWEDE